LAEVAGVGRVAACQRPLRSLWAVISRSAMTGLEERL
jgi:hypothetical protein